MPPLRGALPVDETQSFKRYPYSGGFAPMSRARAIALAQHTLHLSQGKGPSASLQVRRAGASG